MIPSLPSCFHACRYPGAAALALAIAVLALSGCEPMHSSHFAALWYGQCWAEEDHAHGYALWHNNEEEERSAAMRSRSRSGSSSSSPSRGRR